jgi:hypothetical protein
MPIFRRRDSRGVFFQWGSRGARYYFNPRCPACTVKARSLAQRQAAAAYAHGYRHK